MKRFGPWDAGGVIRPRDPRRKWPVAGTNKLPVFDPGRFAVVAIGASTGAPMPLGRMITHLPADLPVPILVAQHLPLAFTASFAKQLNHDAALTVVHAERGMRVLPGTVYLGQGKRHLRVAKCFGHDQIVVSDEPRELLYRPSVDELLRSCAEVYGSRVLAIVMTGIGRDGTEGAAEVVKAGGVVLTQSAETCVVYGMPRSCVEAGLSSAALTPEQLRRCILQLSPGHRDEAFQDDGPTAALRA